MISSAPIEVPKADSLPTLAPGNCREVRDARFSDLRGVQWRINLGILPSSASIYELRRVSADARRRYAGLRRRLLVDPHFRKDGSSSPDPVIDNPLSQNPDSMWGRFFKNAELEKMVDQDLSRLYPEHGSYFQTPACQSMLRRILLLWCLRHPEYGYGQGMHELLAPLLYVLHIDVQRLSEVRKQYEDHFNDKFDDMSFPESGLVCKHKSPSLELEIEDEIDFQESAAKDSSLDELDSEIQTIVLLSDAYGAEGELGIILSERFMEHDAYCMFEALMGGVRGVVAMAEYFSPSPALGSHTGLPPVIEASSALYHLLSVADSSLHSHLIELGVEPQYFALRWLRVLFGREFSLDDLLVIWDEIFASDNGKSSSDAEEYSYGILRCSRGAFISAMAVSMLLHLRSSLLATENATSCLQRLLNFPENVDLKKLIEKAKSMQVLALDKSISSLSPALIGAFDRKSSSVRGHSLSTDSISPLTPLNLVPESYWEEKWRVLHKAEEQRQGSTPKKTSSWKKGFTEKVRSTLARAESDPSPRKPGSGKRESRSSVRRNLLEDLSRELGLDEDLEMPGRNEVESGKNSLTVEAKVDERCSLEDRTKHLVFEKNTDSVAEEACLSGHTGSEERSSVFSASSSSVSRAGDQDNDTEKSSVASNSSADENDVGSSTEEPCGTIHDDSPLPVSDTVGDTLEKSSGSVDAVGKPEAGGKDGTGKQETGGEAGGKDGTGKRETGGKEQRKLRFQWFWKLGRNANDGTSEKGGNAEASRSSSAVDNENIVLASSIDNGCGTSPGDIVDKNVIGTLRNLGQSMLENIQVIESDFQQDRGYVDNVSRNMLVGKGQVTAVAALKELRKISNLLSEM